MFDFAFDPVTKDLIDDGKGSFVLTDTAQTMLMHQVLCAYGESWHDENLGSRLNDLQAFPQVNTVQWAIDEAKRALGVLVSRKRIANLEVTAEMQGQGRVVIATKCRDVSTGNVVSTFVKTGG